MPKKIAPTVAKTATVAKQRKAIAKQSQFISVKDSMKMNNIRADIIDESKVAEGGRSKIDLAVPGGQNSYTLLKNHGNGKDLSMHLFCQDRA